MLIRFIYIYKKTTEKLKNSNNFRFQKGKDSKYSYQDLLPVYFLKKRCLLKNVSNLKAIKK